MVVMFDLKTLQVLHRGAADPDADAILYDPGTHHLFTFNGDAGTSSVIDATSGDRIANITLGGKPEFGVALGDGMIFANLEDSAQVVQIDGQHPAVIRHWSIAPCQSPTGLAIDRAHLRLFSVCRNGLMVVSDALKGRVVATVPIGQGVDAARFDAATQTAFASNGEGSITVVHEVTPDSFTVVATIPTKRGARTMEIDLRTHRVYTATADFGPAPAPTAAQPRPRPAMIPGTFALLELDP
jgi:DNA-binding beta-propeller fold protein YncE